METSRKTLGYANIHHRNLILLCFISYTAAYICRLNYSAVMPELSANHLLTESQMAAIASAFFICYGISQFISGILGDIIKPHKLIACGLLISSMSNLLITVWHSFYALLFLWALNGVMQSFIWAPMLKIAGDYFDDKEKEKFSVDIAAVIPIGTILSYGLCLITMVFLPWNYAFFTCGFVQLASAVLWWLGMKRCLPHLKKGHVPAAENFQMSKNRAASAKELTRLLVISGIALLLISVAVQGTLRNSVNQWIPTFFARQFSTGTGVSLMLTMILPVVNLTGAYLARMVNRKCRNELTTSLIFFAVSSMFLLILCLAGTQNILLALICMAGVLNCMFAINVMLMTMVPLRFAPYGRVSTVGGLIDACAYLGCGGLNLVSGVLLERSGSAWEVLFFFWLFLALTACVITVLSKFRWKTFIDDDKSVTEQISL